jgi:hypothetical protein
MNEMIFIKDTDLRQAMREALAAANVDHNSASLYETMIMRRVGDYKIQPIELTEKGKEFLCEISR